MDLDQNVSTKKSNIDIPSFHNTCKKTSNRYALL